MLLIQIRFKTSPAKESYKFGSLQHVNKTTRKQTIKHNIEVIKHGVDLGSKSLTVWLADGSCFPNQLNFRKAFENTLESLQEIYAALPKDWKMFVDKKLLNLILQHVCRRLGQSYLYASKLGKQQAYTLVDLGHHLPNANIEQIVSLLLMEGKLEVSTLTIVNTGDDDLTVEA